MDGPFSDPAKNIEHFGLTEGMVVADFGAGSGAYTLAVAKKISQSGKVYAVDVQQALLTRLAAVAREAHLSNVEIVWGDIEKVGGSKLADRKVELVIIANVLFQSSARYSILLEAKRVLMPGGRVALVEWQDSFGGLGPKPEQVLGPAEAEQICLQAGFAKLLDFPAGAHHYGQLWRVADKTV